LPNARGIEKLPYASTVRQRKPGINQPMGSSYIKASQMKKGDQLSLAQK